MQRMVRVAEWSQNLDQLVAVDRIAADFAARRLSIRDARVHLDALQSRPPAWPAGAPWVAAGVSTGAAAVFFNGNLIEVAMATLLGRALGLFSAALRSQRALKLLENFFGGALVALAAAVASTVWPALSREVLVLVGIIVLVPGVFAFRSLDALLHGDAAAGAAQVATLVLTAGALVTGLAVANVAVPSGKHL